MFSSLFTVWLYEPFDSVFLSRVSTLTRDIDIALLSVRQPVRPFVCQVGNKKLAIFYQ